MEQGITSERWWRAGVFAVGVGLILSPGLLPAIAFHAARVAGWPSMLLMVSPASMPAS